VGSMASDDPAGWDFFNATIAHADGDPDVHILNNFHNVGGIEVNAVPIEDGVTVYRVSSAEQCAERTLEIVRDPALGKFLGRSGKEHVRAHFLTPRYLRDYLKIFNELRES